MSVSDFVDSDFNGSCSDDCVATETSLNRNPAMVLNFDEDTANRCDVKSMCTIIDLTDASDKSSESIKPTADENRERKPVFSIRFRDQRTARQYQKKVKDFLKNLISKQQTDCEDGGSSDLELDIWEESLEEVDEDQSDDLLLFTVDTHPSMKDDLDIPAYNQKFNEVLQKQDEKVEEKSTPSTPVQTCFNCMGNHCLRDCPEPRHPATIAKNRRDFLSKHGSSVKASRYHMDEEQRFGHFRPGEISHNLRKALGLTRRQLPMHIYRMRTFGYPPGWMEEARISHSGISLFDSEGQEVADPEDEEGQITEGSKDTYDMKKIISYPGFNVPYSRDIVDEFEVYNSPPMALHQSKEAMLSQLHASPVYKKKKLKTTPIVTETREATINLADMEVEEVSQNVSLLPEDDGCCFIPPLPKDTPPPPPPPPPPPDNDSEGSEMCIQEAGSTVQSSVSSTSTQSPSLSDLEPKKKSLQSELEDGNSCEAVRIATTPTLGKVKSVKLGTPVLLGRSPYARLPSPKKFSHNICDVINFENLPDSTGKYEKMTDIIHKVRTVVARIQSDPAS